MPIIRWEPFFPFEDIEKELRGLLPSEKAMPGPFLPAIDVYKEKDNLVAEAHIPEVDPDSLEVSIENNVLTIQGKSEKRKEIEEKNFYRREVRHGSFYRSVALPARVAGDKAEASYDKGVLKVVVPLAPEEKAKKPKKIKVKTKKA